MCEATMKMHRAWVTCSRDMMAKAIGYVFEDYVLMPPYDDGHHPKPE